MQKQPTEKIILGIDPGTAIMGYGILLVRNNKPSMVAMGVLELKKYSDHYLKLQKIFDRVIQLIDSYHPDELAIEAPFFGKNVQSMLKLGRAQELQWLRPCQGRYLSSNTPPKDKAGHHRSR